MFMFMFMFHRLTHLQFLSVLLYQPTCMFCDLEDECGLCIKMDDDSCVLKYIEIVPFENNVSGNLVTHHFVTIVFDVRPKI